MRCGSLWRRRLPAAVAILALGFAYSALVLGLRPLDPANVDWLKGDPLEHYLGWLFFTETPGWSFPFTWSDRLGYPVGTYLSLIDPALLTTFGWFDRILPPHYQYLGLFYAINASLQLYWGFRLTHRLAGGNRFVAAVGGLMFLLSPIMAQKGQGHFSGGCHWPILAGLYYLLGDDGLGRPLRWMATLWLLTGFSAVIHPYLGATLCMLACLGVLRLCVEGQVGWTGGPLLVVISGVALAAPLYAIGVLSVGGGAAAGGFQDYTFNLLAPFNPMAYPSLLPMRMPAFTLQEFEGYAYLGLGVLGLLVVLLAAGKPWRMRSDDRGKQVTVAAVLICCLLVAVSNRVTVGQHVLFEYPLPKALVFLTTAFRAPARFIWPAYYLVMGLSVAGVARIGHTRRTYFLLAAAVVLQFIDLSGVRDHVRHFQADPSSNPAIFHEWSTAWPGPSPVWNRIGLDHAHLAVLPAWQCGTGNSPGGEAGYAIFGRLAATLGMTINEYRASRYAPSSLIAHCRDIPAAVAAGRLQGDTAYVLSDDLFLRLQAAEEAPTHHCARIDGYNLCLSGAPTDAPNWRSVVPPVQPGQTVLFRQGGDGVGLLSSDWLRAEAWGVWSGARKASLTLPLAKAGDADLTIALRPLLGASRPTQVVHLTSQGRPVAQWTLAWDTAPQQVHIPAGLVPASGILELGIEVDELTAPSQLGYPGDDRPLGVGLVSIGISRGR